MMDLDRLLLVYESETVEDALKALAEHPPVRAALWTGTAGESARAWPRESIDPTDLNPLPAQAEIRRARGGDLLVLPLEGTEAALALQADEGSFGEGPDPWLRLPRAIARLATRERELREIRTERNALRQRAEESEALHVVGLAANRSLDPDEVLTLVSRFIRTLLGADYVTVSTADGDVVRTVAAIGLLNGDPPPVRDRFAAEVVRRGKPLNLVDAPARWKEKYPFHASQSMSSGLGVPLSLFGNTFGALVIAYRRPHVLESRETRLALTLAGHAAVAISNARLHRTLADRSAELERAITARSRFFASMSHELRTPLSGILGYQELLLDGFAGELSESQRDLAVNASRAARSLLLLINDVLDLAKLEAGRVEMEIRRVRAADLVREAVTTVRPLAHQKGLDLRVRRHAGLPELDTDPDRVHQILLNLLSNAVKFTARGSITVTVTVEEDTTPLAGRSERASLPQWLAIRVSDTGVGIPLDDQERIFHEFEQVAGPASRGGTGLGLAVSRQLARLLGGELGLESTPGEGSTFTLRLPLLSRTEVDVGTPLAP